MIWKRHYTIDDLNHKNMLGSVALNLGVRVVEIAGDFLSATMPVDERTQQPMGILHGGVSCLLAETLCSVGANMCLDQNEYFAVGLNLTAHHVRSIKSGTVFAKAMIKHLGKTTQLWEAELTDENERVLCKISFTAANLKKNR